MSTECKECGRWSPEVKYGLHICVLCAGPHIGNPEANDAVARAIAALLRDVVEEHGVKPCTTNFGCSCDDCVEMRMSARRAEASRRQEQQTQGPSHIHAMARQNAYARAAEQQQAIHARWYDQYGSLQQQTTRLDAAVKHAAQVYGVTEEQVRAADESARVLGGSVVFGVEGFKEELKEACGQSCSTCGTELLSDESRERGTCYDHR